MSKELKSDMDLLDLGPFPPKFFLDALHTERIKSDFDAGIVAAVELYYQDYTDADCLEPAFLQALRKLEEFITILDCDIDKIIFDTEESIRTNTGRDVRTIATDPELDEDED